MPHCRTVGTYHAQGFAPYRALFIRLSGNIRGTFTAKMFDTESNNLVIITPFTAIGIFIFTLGNRKLLNFYLRWLIYTQPICEYYVGVLLIVYYYC